MPFSELAARYQALPPLNPPRQRNLHAAMEEARRRNDGWMQQMHNMSRQNITGYQVPGNNNNDDDIYVDELVWDHPPPVSFLKLYF